MATLLAVALDYMIKESPEGSSVVSSNDTLVVGATMRRVPWAYIPYPGQFSTEVIVPESKLEAPRFRALPLALVCMVRSISDYLATARILRAPPPPAHAVNRAQCIDGLFSMLAGGLGIPPVSSQIGFTGFR